MALSPTRRFCPIEFRRPRNASEFDNAAYRNIAKIPNLWPREGQWVRPSSGSIPTSRHIITYAHHALITKGLAQHQVFLRARNGAETTQPKRGC
jgi:hypothetical protein